MNLHNPSFAGLLASLLCGSALTACGGSTSSTAGGDAGHTTSTDASHASDSGHAKDAGAGDAGSATTAATACAKIAAATCTLIATCVPRDTSAEFGDAGNCLTREELACEASLSAPGTSRTAAQDVACATAMATESCASYLNGDQPTACLPGAGGGATGSACSYSAQCSSAYCAVPLAGACGTCQPAPTAGASCAGMNGCGPGLTCFQQTTCVLPGTTGSPCSATAPCGAGLSCVMAKAATTGLCQGQGQAVGATCDPADVTGASCDSSLGLYCDRQKTSSTFHTCLQASTATAGQPCGLVSDVLFQCTADSVCIKQAAVGDAGATSTCVARAADGASCNTLAGPDCLPPSRCLGTLLDAGASGTCTLPGTTACP